LTKGFKNNNPLIQQQTFKEANKPLITTGHIGRRF